MTPVVDSHSQIHAQMSIDKVDTDTGRLMDQRQEGKRLNGSQLLLVPKRASHICTILVPWGPFRWVADSKKSCRTRIRT